MKRMAPVFICCVFLFGCRSTPPTIIGADTRVKFNSAIEETAQIKTRAEVMDLSINTIASDLSTIEPQIPDDIKDEYHSIQTKVALLSSASVFQKTDIINALDLEKQARDSFEIDMGETARLAEEKAKADVKIEQVSGQRNIAWLILAVILIIVCVLVWIKLKPKISIL
jgi:hypothetical protein